MASSATTNFVRVPELLSRVFFFSTTEDNGRNLLVCKLWSNEVLNIEWKEVTEARHLYRLLAPLKTPEATELTCFTRRLTPEDWIRFDRYAWRIKSLDLWSSTSAVFDMSLYHEIAATRNRLDFLPNLHTLSIPDLFVVVQLFAHASVISLSVRPLWVYDEDDVNIEGASLFSHMRYKMPNLQRLSIDLYVSPRQIAEIQTESALTFRELKKLSYIALPPSWMRESVTKAASELPNLHTFHVEYSESPDPYEGLDAPLFSTCLTTSSFPELTSLMIWMPFSRAIACFSQAFRPTSLEVLELDATVPPTPKELTQLIEIIGSSCAHLRILSLGARRNYPLDLASLPQESYIQLEDLKPLSSRKHLRELRLSHDQPFLLLEFDIVQLLKPLKLLEALHLNPEPRLQTPSSLPMSCLSSIASACPSLSSLGLYMSASSSDLPKSDPMVSFKLLKTLDVGRSMLAEKDWAPVSSYLGHILPQNCGIEFSRYSDFPPPQGHSTAQWEKVGQLAPLFQQAVEDGERRVLSRSNER